MTEVRVNTNTTLGVTHERIHFGGTGDDLTFILGNADTVIATGRDQVIRTIDTPTLTIVDHARGLHIFPEYGGITMTVYDFQHDPTGQFSGAGGSINFAPDGHGGTLVSFAGPTILGSIDFVGYSNAAKLATHLAHV
jgi:hypothetical protein